MKYLLFVYPCDDNWDAETSNQTFANELVKIIKDEQLKFVYGENHSIFNFTSDLSQSEVDDYVKLIKGDVPEFMYVLVQNAKTITSDMDQNNFEHLIGKKKRKPRAKKENPKVGFNISAFMEEHRKRVDEFLKNNVCNLTIDEILDKIIDQGIDSLTRAEKDTLDEYSKQL